MLLPAATSLLWVQASVESSCACFQKYLWQQCCIKKDKSGMNFFALLIFQKRNSNVFQIEEVYSYIMKTKKT